jgi:outer membrane protein OmpA-like peptidoglycan-associated protein
MTSKHTPWVLALCCAAFVLSGCENMSARQKGGTVGAGVGAVGGAVISSATGGKAGTGAVAGGLIGAVVGNLWSKRQEDRRIAMERASQGTGIEVSRTPDNQLKLNVPSDISFDVNSANIKPELRSILETFANSLRGDPQARANIIGHTSSEGSDAVNDPLSLRRANSVRDFLSDRGIAASRIETAGRGEHEPIADNNTEAGRAKNRRVEIFLREPG